MLLLGGDLGEDLDGLIDLLLELHEVVKVALDLLKRKIDEHTGDLGGLLFTNDLLDVFVDEFTNELLEVGVVGDNDGEEGETLLVVGVDESIGVSEGLEITLDGELSGLSSGKGSRSLTNVLLLVRVLSGTALVSLLEAIGSGTTTVHLTTVARTTESVLLEARLSAVHLLLEKDEDLLDELDGVGASEEVRVEGGSLESSLGHEVSSVSGLNLLLLADLRKLVVGDIEGLVLEDVLLSTSVCSGLRALVANECSCAKRS